MTDLVTLMEETWPPVRAAPQGAFTLREGGGGGQRVSAATASGPWTDTDIAQAEAAMGASSLFMLRPSQSGLDDALAKRGYTIRDPVVVYAASCTQIAGAGPDWMTTFAHWPPLQIAGQLWAEGGVGQPRLDIMMRVQGPKTAVLARTRDRAAGIAFVAIAEAVAFVHALYVTPDQRRQGSARNILRAAAIWGRNLGADRIALAVTAANGAARAGYDALGMRVADQYHYRVRP